ncbi:MAG: hypothetical protein RL213_1250 [Bacteroidota bacterium]|jgi:acetyl esterase/lipase
MKKRLLPIVLSLVVSMVQGQQPYTLPVHPYDSTLDIIYGIDTAYNGQPVPLTYSAYRPVGDLNCLRPLIVLIHGGAWIAGDKSDPDLVYFAREFARRGWFAVTTNYRMGNHKTDNYAMYPFCNPSLATPCAYISDSSEVIRANYRAQQDIKGLLRFLALRSSQDSTDIRNVFLAGESAGGFIALTTTFLDRPSEKPADCGALSAAPVPDADMLQYGCSASGAGLLRPDLGDIDGRLHTGAPAYVIRGVASFFGGVLDTSIFQQGGALPRVYLFHQGSDVVVHYDRGRLLGRISYECFAPNNICQPFFGYPAAYGGEAIRRHFVQSGSAAPVFRAEIINNYEYQNDCFDNGHSVDNIAQRTNEMADFFSRGIDTAANHTGWSCSAIGIPETDLAAKIKLYPNPVSDRLEIAADVSLLPLEYVVYSAGGQTVFSGLLKEPLQSFPVSFLSPGNYYLRFPAYSAVFTFTLAR